MARAQCCAGAVVCICLVDAALAVSNMRSVRAVFGTDPNWATNGCVSTAAALVGCRRQAWRSTSSNVY